MINQGEKEMMATQAWRANERKIAAAELSRQAKAARNIGDSPDRAFVIRLASGLAIGSVAGAWCSLRRSLVGMVLRRTPA